LGSDPERLEYLHVRLPTSYLQDAARLAPSEAYLELLLDTYTGKALRACASTLPREDSVRRLTPRVGTQFQAVARREGVRRGLPPLHLDVFG